jgi:hypothetical protein
MKRLLSVLIVRMLGPALSIAIILAIEIKVGSQLAAAYVILLACLNIASSLGKLGFDQRLYLSAPKIRNGNFSDVMSIAKTYFIFSSFASSVLAIIIYVVLSYVFNKKIDYFTFPIFFVSSLMFTITQINSSILLAKGKPYSATFAFPLGFYALFLAGFLLEVAPPETLVPVALTGALIFGAAMNREVFSLSAMSAKIDVAMDNGIYYLQTINFTISQWGVYIYMHVLLSPDAVVQFAIASRVAAAFALPINALTPYLLPELATRHDASDRSASASYVGDVAFLTIAYQFLLGIALVISYLMLPTNYIDAYVNLAGLIAILILGQTVAAVTGPIGAYLLMSQHRRTIVYWNTAITLFSILIGITLANFIGVIGVAITATGTIIAQRFVYMRKFMKDSPLGPLSLIKSSAVRTIRKVKCRLKT